MFPSLRFLVFFLLLTIPSAFAQDATLSPSYTSGWPAHFARQFPPGSSNPTTFNASFCSKERKYCLGVVSNGAGFKPVYCRADGAGNCPNPLICGEKDTSLLVYEDPGSDLYSKVAPATLDGKPAGAGAGMGDKK